MSGDHSCVLGKGTYPGFGVISGSNVDYSQGMKCYPEFSTWNQVLRGSSMTVASESPFAVFVRTVNDGWLRYAIQGEKPTKIVFPKENSIIGNCVALKAAIAAHTSDYIPLIKFVGAADPVDVTINLCKDNTIDNGS